MRTHKLSNLTKGIILVVAILGIGAGLVVWKNKVGGAASTSFNSISRSEIEMLLADVAKTNPTVLKKLATNPEMKKQQIDNLKQLLAFASEAVREGMADDPTNKQELDNIRSEIIAVNYDREINKDKGPMPAFGYITDDQVKAYWAEAQTPPPAQSFMEKIGFGGTSAETRSHEDEFNAFLNAKIAVLKANDPEMKDREITDEEKTQARDIFAKVRIYRNEYDQKAKSGELSEDFVKKTALQVKLQQAQFLAKLYAAKAAEETKVSDEEIDQYIKDHPEINPVEKRAKAQGILDRAKAGEDFAALANEFTEDPGNKGTDGKDRGGEYKDVPKGRMVAPFEQAALTLEAGQVYPELVETDFGFHIIKLERKLGPSSDKGEEKDEEKGKDGKKEDTYDVRHILISTGVKDPDNPNARETPIKDYVRNKLESEKEKALIDKLVAENNISVPDDFTVPEPTEEELQQMQQKQQMPQGMPPGAPVEQPAAPDAKTAKPTAKKPEPKK